MPWPHVQEKEQDSILIPILEVDRARRKCPHGGGRPKHPFTEFAGGLTVGLVALEGLLGFSSPFYPF